MFLRGSFARRLGAGTVSFRAKSTQAPVQIVQPLVRKFVADVRAGKLQDVEAQLVRLPHFVNQYDEQSQMLPLGVALQEDKISVIEALVANGASMHARVFKQMDLLHCTQRAIQNYTGGSKDLLLARSELERMAMELMQVIKAALFTKNFLPLYSHPLAAQLPQLMGIPVGHTEVQKDPLILITDLPTHLTLAGFLKEASHDLCPITLNNLCDALSHHEVETYFLRLQHHDYSVSSAAVAH